MEESAGVLEQIFIGKFGSTIQGFLPFSRASLTQSCLFWYGLKDLFSLHKLDDEVNR